MYSSFRMFLILDTCRTQVLVFPFLPHICIWPFSRFPLLLKLAVTFFFFKIALKPIAKLSLKARNIQTKMPKYSLMEITLRKKSQPKRETEKRKR